MDDQQRDYAEEAYNRDTCPECDYQHGRGEACPPTDMRLTEDEFLSSVVTHGMHAIIRWVTEVTPAGTVVSSAVVAGWITGSPFTISYDAQRQGYVTTKGLLYACRRHPRFKGSTHE